MKLTIQNKPEIWNSVKNVLDRIDLAPTQLEQQEAKEEIGPLFSAVVCSGALELTKETELSMSKGKSEVFINEVKAVTPKAVLCDLEFEDERAEIWLPYSQCEDLEDYDLGDGRFHIQVPNWILVEHDLMEG